MEGGKKVLQNDEEQEDSDKGNQGDGRQIWKNDRK